MNGQDYFKEVKKIRDFLHDVSSSRALLWGSSTAYGALIQCLYFAYILIQFKKLHHKGSLFYADQFSKKETGGKKLSYLPDSFWLPDSDVVTLKVHAKLNTFRSNFDFRVSVIILDITTDEA